MENKSIKLGIVVGLFLALPSDLMAAGDRSCRCLAGSRTLDGIWSAYETAKSAYDAEEDGIKSVTYTQDNVCWQDLSSRSSVAGNFVIVSQYTMTQVSTTGETKTLSSETPLVLAVYDQGADTRYCTTRMLQFFGGSNPPLATNEETLSLTEDEYDDCVNVIQNKKQPECIDY